MSPPRVLDPLLQDVRYATRSLRRRPLVTAVAVLSLALGIGVNTTIFSVFERLLLREVHAPAAADIVNVIAPGPKPGGRSTGNAGGPDAVISYPLFRDLERLQIGEISNLAAQRNFGANVAHRGRTMRAEGLVVSGGYFPALRIVPAAGRLLTPDDDRIEGGHAVAVLSHRYWTTQFSADRGVVGESLVVNGEPMTIVGVAADGFTGTVAMDAPQVFVPLAMAGRLRAGGGTRRDHWLYVFARLQPSVTRERAQAALDGPFAALIRDVEYPVHAGELVGRAREQFLARRLVLEDGRRMRLNDPAEARLVLGLLLAVTGLVLLIACANVANLLLARAADRSTEMAVRVSIGASAARLVRLLLVEASMLGMLGAVGALGVAKAASVALLSIMPPDDAQSIGFELNASIVVYALAIGVGTALLFGLFPALHASRWARGSAASVQSTRVSSSRSARRFRTSLTTAQIALATALLAQAGLFITSLVNIAGAELGIEREGLITFRLAPYLNGYTPERAMSLFDRVQDELRRTPGVIDVTATTVPLLSENRQRPNVIVEGFAAGSDTDLRASYAQVGDGYFRTLGIPLLAGREFSSADRAGAPKVAIVNEAFARKFRLRSPIGRRVALAAAGVTAADIEIVAVVADAKYADIRESAPPQLYVPYRQGEVGPLTFYAKASADPRQLRTIIAGLVARADPNLPVERLRTMDEQVWDNVTRDRVLATLSSWFAGLATLLAGIGLYALLAFAVTQRVKEIGIRMALGARNVDVARLLVWHIGRMAVIGGGVGLAVAVALGRLGEALLFGVKATDPSIIAGTVGAVGTVILAAAVIPTRRATRVNPVDALRAD
jgi:predicted permease